MKVELTVYASNSDDRSMGGATVHVGQAMAIAGANVGIKHHIATEGEHTNGNGSGECHEEMNGSFIVMSRDSRQTAHIYASDHVYFTATGVHVNVTAE